MSRLSFFFFYLFALTRIDSTPMCVDLGRIGSYRLNIGVFWPEKGNRPVRKKKLKTKILVDIDTR